MGTAPLASIYWGNDAATAEATVAKALEFGVRFFDTAPFYGLGEAERRLGRALASAPSQVTIATKVGRTLTTTPDGSADVFFDFSYDAVNRVVEASLERLGVDRVDIVHIHDPDDHIDEAVSETFPALVALRDEGAIGAVSLGTNTVSVGRTFLERADLDCMLVAGRYTLLDRSAASLIEACSKQGVGYLAAGVFNSGVLARPEPGAWYDYGPVAPELLKKAQAMSSVCEGHGVALREAAVNFPLTNPGVTSVVVGMAAPSEVAENLATLRRRIPAELWDKLDVVAGS